MTGQTEVPMRIEDQIMQQATAEALAKVLPNELSVPRFQRIVISAIRANGKIAECDPASIMSCVMMACQLGLEPNTPEGLCYLIPRGKKCTLLIGYKGAETVAYKSGNILNIKPGIRYENDGWEYKEGLNPVLDHTPSDGERGAVVGAYVIVKCSNGEKIIKYMRESDILEHRPSPWNTTVWASKIHTRVMAMYEKTVVFQALKHAPTSPSIKTMIACDEAFARGASVHYEDGDPRIQEPQRRVPQLQDFSGKGAE